VDLVIFLQNFYGNFKLFDRIISYVPNGHIGKKFYGDRILKKSYVCLHSKGLAGPSIDMRRVGDNAGPKILCDLKFKFPHF
jgi:hypothetical protein